MLTQLQGTRDSCGSAFVAQLNTGLTMVMEMVEVSSSSTCVLLDIWSHWQWMQLQFQAARACSLPGRLASMYVVWYRN